MILDCFSSSAADQTQYSLDVSAPGASTGSGVALPPKIFCLGRQKDPQKGARFGLGRADLQLPPPPPLLFLSLASFTIWLFFGGGGFLFASWFRAFSRAFWLRRDSRFPPPIIKIWKLNFHSISFFFFSNHLIKISSTTTKKIRSSCSK